MFKSCGALAKNLNIKNMEKYKQRNTNVEVLRMLVMFGILLWHVTVHGYGLAHMAQNGVSVIDHEFMNSLCVALFAPCVNLFVLISGYYGIHFSLKTICRFEAQAVFYSVVMAAVVWFAFGELNAGKLAVVFPVLRNRWWFLTTYILLFTFAPIINEGVRRLTERQHLTLIALFCALNAIATHNGSCMQSFLLVYLIGRYLNMYKDKRKILTNKKIITLGWLLCTAINLAAIYFCWQAGVEHPELITKGIMAYLNYSNPVILLQSILILCGVLALKPTFNGRTNSVAKHVFGVYLITEALAMHLYKPLKDVFNDSFMLGMAACIVVFTVCLMVEAVRSKGYNVILDKFSPYMCKCSSKIKKKLSL